MIKIRINESKPRTHARTDRQTDTRSIDVINQEYANTAFIHLNDISKVKYMI